MKLYSQRQQQIIDSAIELIAQQSIQALTIKNLSSKIGVTEAALYRHFGSKMEILLAILEYFKQNSINMLHQITQLPLSSPEKIESIFRNRFKIFADKPSLAAVIFSEEIFQNDPRLSEMVSEIMNFSLDTLITLIEKGQHDGLIRTDIDKEELAIIMVGGLRLMVTRWRLSKFGFDLQKKGEAYIQAVRMLIKKEK